MRVIGILCVERHIRIGGNSQGFFCVGPVFQNDLSEFPFVTVKRADFHRHMTRRIDVPDPLFLKKRVASFRTLGIVGGRKDAFSLLDLYKNATILSQVIKRFCQREFPQIRPASAQSVVECEEFPIAHGKGVRNPFDLGAYFLKTTTYRLSAFGKITGISAIDIFLRQQKPDGSHLGRIGKQTDDLIAA